MNFPHALFLSAKLFYTVSENEEKLVTWLENVQADAMCVSVEWVQNSN